ncbi:MAG TPA: YncE family protein [Bryobacteraceae bacterium]|jgi:YVTN family beta-propeller protein|nr:YncE family protein [Bryobacteraceae bacterium]
MLRTRYLIASLLRNSRKTVAVPSAPPQERASSGFDWRHASAPFALTVAAAFLLLHTQAVSGQSGQEGPELLVANQGDHTMGIVDPRSGQQVAAIPEQDKVVHGHEVIASPDGRTAYLPMYGNVGVGHAGADGTEMLVIDIPDRKITGKVDFGHGVRPHCPIINPADGMLYVTTELDDTVSIIDPKTLKIVGTVPTGQKESHMLVISSDGRRGYTANVGPGTVSVLDLQGRKTVAVIKISGETQRISISPDNKMVFTADQNQPRLAVIDTASNTVKTWVSLPASGYGTAPTKDGRYLLVAVPKTNQVSVVDLKTLEVVRNVDVAPSPQEVLVRPDGKFAYVSCNKSGQIAEIDLSTWKVQKMIKAGAGADGLAWASAT